MTTQQPDEVIVAEISRRLSTLEARADAIETHTALSHSRAIGGAVIELERTLESWTTDPPMMISAIDQMMDSKQKLRQHRERGEGGGRIQGRRV